MEAENVILLPDENLIDEGQSPLHTPDWSDRVGEGVLPPQGSAGGQLYLLIVAAVRNPTDPLTGPAGRVVLLLVTPPRTVPVVRVSYK